ncbi:IS256-like element IS1553 family transposase [soil metagenome]
MRKSTLGKVEAAPRLGVLIHEAVRKAIERAVEEELAAALGAPVYARTEERRGYRNGSRSRSLTGPTGKFEMNVPRATMFTKDGGDEWRSKLLPRYARRIAEVNEAVTAAYLSGANTRRIRGALGPLLRDAPLSKSAVSRVIVTLKDAFDEWKKRPLGGLNVVYMYLDAIVLKVRSAKKVVGMPILVAVAVLANGDKQLVSLEACTSESKDGWKGFLDEMTARGLEAPLLAIVDGGAGLLAALAATWNKVSVQRCTVHKLRNIARKAPKHAYDEIKIDYHRIVYAADLKTALAERDAFCKKWGKTCRPVVESLLEAGDELLTFFRFPKAQWKTLRTTNLIERLNGEFRRRVKTQCSLCTENAAVVILFSLVATGQIRLRKIDGWTGLANVVNTKSKEAKQLANTKLKAPAKHAA